MNSTMTRTAIRLMLLAGLLAGCAEPENRSTGVYMLLDTSGT